jgi:hypothetical protein
MDSTDIKDRHRVPLLLRGHIGAPSENENPIAPGLCDSLPHLAENDDGDGLSPASKKIIERNRASRGPSITHHKQSAPLVIQRPQSSGIDITGFNYAKPTQCGTRLYFRPPPGQSSADPPNVGEIIHSDQESKQDENGVKAGLAPPKPE